MNVTNERFENGRRGFAGWRARIGSGRGIPTPAVSGTNVIVGGGFGSHEVWALDTRTGNIKWRLRTRDDGPTAAVVLGSRAFFNTESCTLMAVDAATGAVQWEKWLGDPLLAQPAAADDRVLMAFPRKGSHWLGAFELRTGTPQWEARLEHDVITAPIVVNGRTYVATYDGAVSCFSTIRGEILWTRAMSATSAPWVSADTVYVAQRSASSAGYAHQDRRKHEPPPTTPRERTAAVSDLDGATLDASAWKSAVYLSANWGDSRKRGFAAHDADVGFAHAPAAAKMHQVHDLVGEAHVSRAWRFQGSRPVVKDGVIFEATGDGLEARALETGWPIWSWRDARAEEGERRLTPPAVSNRRVLFGTWDGRLVSLNATDGSVRWVVNVGAPCHWQPVMASGRVFAGLEDGSVVSFETDDVGDDGWPMWGGGPGHNGSEPAHVPAKSVSSEELDEKGKRNYGNNQ